MKSNELIKTALILSGINAAFCCASNLGKYIVILRPHTKLLRLYIVKEEAMECVNDVLPKVWEKICHHDETKNKFSSWLIAVSKYNALDYKRKLIKIEEQYNIEDLMLADEKQVEEQILCNEGRQELIKVIDTLGSPDKDIFIRKYFMGESINEISEALNLTKPAIKNRLFRGRKILKDKLNPMEMEAL